MNPIAEWNEKLQSARQRIELHAKWSRRLETLEAEMEWQRRSVEEDSQRLAIEQGDVDKLRGSTFSQFMLNLFGRLDDKLTKEEREAAEAKLKYDASEALLQGMERERAELIAKMADTGGAEQDYQTLMAEKEHWIQAHDPQTRETLERLSEETGKLKAMLVELAEAVRAGERVEFSLEKAEEKLSSARNWGTYDMLGGGMIATAVKHSRIDDAQSFIHAAHDDLRLFRKELRDLNWSLNANELAIGGFLTFADYFFDGLLSDWSVQGKIKDSLGSVTSQLGDVRNVMDRLKRERKRMEQESADLAARYRQTIESYA